MPIPPRRATGTATAEAAAKHPWETTSSKSKLVERGKAGDRSDDPPNGVGAGAQRPSLAIVVHRGRRSQCVLR